MLFPLGSVHHSHALVTVERFLWVDGPRVSVPRRTRSALCALFPPTLTGQRVTCSQEAPLRDLSDLLHQLGCPSSQTRPSWGCPAAGRRVNHHWRWDDDRGALCEGLGGIDRPIAARTAKGVPAIPNRGSPESIGPAASPRRPFRIVRSRENMTPALQAWITLTKFPRSNRPFPIVMIVLKQ